MGPLLVLLAASAWAAPAEEAWPRSETAHFTIAREAVGVSLGDNSLLERLHDDLHRELWSLVPWMEEEKVKVYLYKDRDSYLAGMFQPPPWSGGLMRAAGGEKSLALVEPLEAGTAAHELSHLYLRAFFEKRPPPPWLDEGLAGLLESEALTLPDPRDRGPVLPAPLPLRDLVATRPSSDSPQERVGLWYRQAHSLVRFLKRGRSEDRFTDFCRALKGGAELDAALRSAYGWEGLPALEQDWLRWRPRKPAGLPSGLDDL